MHVKSFLAGSVAGAFLTAAGMILITPRSETTGVDIGVRDTGSTSASPADVRSDIDGASALESADIEVAPSPVESVSLPEPEFQRLSPPSSARATNRPIPVPATAQHSALLDEYADVVPEATAPSNSRRDLEAEPRDYEWSYFMEQSIGQYLATHPESIYFDVAGIECRSTICEI